MRNPVYPRATQAQTPNAEPPTDERVRTVTVRVIDEVIYMIDVQVSGQDDAERFEAAEGAARRIVEEEGDTLSRVVNERYVMAQE